jgi:carbamoyl-phosphate synthase large subunit
VDENRIEIADSRSIRITSQLNKVTYYTTISAALAAVSGIRAINELEVYDLQSLHHSLQS